MKDDFSSLLQKEMDRKDFLKHVGIGFAVITGAATLLKTMNGFGNPLGRSVGSPTAGGYGNGYGTSAYGGNSKVSNQAVAPAAYS